MVDLAGARRRGQLEAHRRAAAEYLADQEDLFATAVAAAFRAVFAPVLERFATATTVTADAAGFASPDDLNTIRSDWLAEVEHTLAPMVSVMYDTGALSALLAHVAAYDARTRDETLDLLDDVLNRRAHDYLETATNRLVGIGDTAWATARESLLDGFTIGESVPDLAQRVQDALGVAETRAVTIARTEVVGASNAGSLGAVEALGEYGPARKVWLATVDSRTRESHMDADGQEVALDEPFQVGGYDLEFPGDPAGPAEEVINCRCTVIYREAEDIGNGIDDVAGRGQGGTPDLAAQSLDQVAASGHEEDPAMARRNRLAVRTRSGFVVPPPPTRDDYAPGDPPVDPPAPDAAPADAPAPEVTTDGPADVTLQVPEGYNIRPFEAILAVEGRWTGDDRYLLPGALRWDGMLPAPVDVNHDNTVESTVGLIGEVYRVPGPNEGETLVVARGFFDLGRADRPHEAAQFVVDRIESGVLRGVSMQIDDETLGGVDPATLQPGDDPWWMMVVEDSRLRALTVCPVGAFAECAITLDPEGIDVTTLPPAVDGPVAVTQAEAQAIEEAMEEEVEALLDDLPGGVVVVASGTGYDYVADAPAGPPPEWFADPELDGPTALTITDPDEHGYRRVYGHLATWGTCHTGFQGQCITPPHSSPDYAAFRTGEVVARDGSRHAVGRLTLGTGHAPTSLRSGPAAAHYDDTGTAIADVAAGEDRHGIWLNGAIRRGATDEQIATAMSSPPSGDWRRIGTRMELIAALHVNVPGFPVPRARVAGGVPQALVAANTPLATGTRRPTDPKVDAAAERIARTIGRDRASLVAALDARVHPDEE